MTIFRRRKLARGQQKKLEDDARLLRAWKAWHAEQLADALAGAHGATIAELMLLLDRLELNSAAMLLDFIRRVDWSEISYDTKLVVLHETNQAIIRLRERHGMSPIDDPVLPEQPDNIFRRIRAILLTPSVATERTGRDVTAAVQAKE